MRNSKIKDNYGLGDFMKFNRYDPQDKNFNVQVMLNKKLIMLIHRFKWKNLPEGIDPFYLELVLVTAGCGIFVKENGKYYFTFGNLAGKQDARYFPVDFIVTNPWIPINKTYRIENDEDGVFCRNDYLCQGELPILYKHLYQLSETELSQYIANIMGRLTAIIKSNTADKKAKQSAELLLKRIKEGELGIVTENRFQDEAGISAIPISSSLHDTLITLIEYHKFIEEQLSTNLGLKQEGNRKREAINEAEIDSDNYTIIANIIDQLKQREDFCERLNKFTGGNTTVEYDGAFDLQYHDIELDIEKEEAEVEQIEAETEKIEKEDEKVEETEEVKEENKEDEEKEGEEDGNNDEDN